MRGIIEVGPEGDASKFRNLVAPFLNLSIKVKALLKSDKPQPVVTTFILYLYFATQFAIEAKTGKNESKFN
jgi:hypothetical protein